MESPSFTLPQVHTTPSTTLAVNIDAGCYPNPGGTAFGACVIHKDVAIPGLARDIVETYALGHGTGMSSNRAEYETALRALRTVWSVGWRGHVTLRTDSQLLAQQFAGAYGCYEPHLIDLLQKLRHASTYFDGVEIMWIPRSENYRADSLVRRAFRHATRHRP